jgi:hypothetical protein
LSQGLLQGAGADGQGGVAGGPLGLAEGGGPGGDQEAGQAEDVVPGGLDDTIGELLGVGFLLRGE